MLDARSSVRRIREDRRLSDDVTQLIVDAANTITSFATNA
jgi:hypothetical protein